MDWNELRKRSPVLRKGWDFARRVPRAAVRISSGRENYLLHPPLLGNSFPKSGTHQLLQVLAAFPNARSWGSFLASQPSFTFRERSAQAHIRRIRALVPGEYLGAHLFHEEAYAGALEEMNAAHFLIYRDLRDVAVSEMYYLRDMNRWHRMHGYFSDYLSSDDERLMTAICGVQDRNFQYNYPDIATRMRRYLPWIARNDTFALKYEDLNSANREELIRKMVAFYARRSAAHVDTDRVVSRACRYLDPSRSHTYRVGGSGGWRRVFGSEHTKAMELLCGDLLVELGYTA